MWLPALVASLLVAPAAAVETTAAGPRWMVDRWTVDDGLPMDHLNAVARGPDGRLWLATYDGLWSFDGHRFDQVPVGTPEGTPGPRIHALARAPLTEDLWLTLEGGEVQRRGVDGVETWLPGIQGPFDLRLDAGGGLWLSGSTRCLLLVDPSDPEAPPALPPPEPAPPEPGCPTGITAPALRPSAFDGGPLHAGADGQIVDPDGLVIDLGEPIRDALWLDGQLWLATTGAGLVRIRSRPIEVVEAPAGLSPIVSRLQWDAATGSVWARSLDDRWWSTVSPETAVEPPGLHATAGDLPRMDNKSLPFAAPPWDDALRWWGTEQELRRERADGRLEPVSGPKGFWQLLDTLLLPDASLLVATTDGLWRVRPGGASEVEDLGGAPVAVVRSLVLVDPNTVAMGGGGQASVGFVDLRTDEAVLRELDSPVRHVRVDSDWIWLSTEQLGLCAVSRDAKLLHRLLDPNQWRCLGADRGLGSPGVHASMPDGKGLVWMSANRGIGVATEATLVGFARGERDEVGVTWLGTQAGLLDAEANGTIGGTVVTAPDGSLYFPTQDGVARVVPARYRDPPLPRVALHAAVVDGEEVAVDGSMLTISDQARLVELSWSPVSLATVEGLRVRHRLSGDAAWSRPTTDRRLRVRGLEPGTHRFEVQAGIGDRWGPATHVELRRPPGLTERGDIRIGLLLAATLSLLGAVGLQRRRSRRQAELLHARIEDATAALRVARDQLAQDNSALATEARSLDARNVTLDHQNVELARQGAQLTELVHERELHAHQLEELARLKRRLVANISHELRTPLTLIRGPLEVLAASEADPGRRQDLLLATRNAARLEALVRDLLLLSRAESGSLPLHAQRMTFAALLGRLLDRFPRERVVLAPLPADPPEGFWCDPAMLDTALGNLVANALEHGRAESPVTVEVRLALADGTPGVFISVRDHGPGVTASAREGLFTRFERGEGGGGLGLGLALTRELVELHGGQLDEVEPDGPGACFRAWLPLGAEHLTLEDIDADAACESGITAPEPPPATDAGVVLLVEDNAELRSFISAHLETRHSVVAMGDAEGALEWLETHAAKALVSDIMLPGMSGLDLARRLRSGGRSPPLPILLISARGEVTDRVEGLEVADDYLPKPFSVRELLARLDALLRRAQGGPAAPSPGAAEPPAPPDTPAWLDELTAALDAHVEAHLADPTLDAADLARAVAMSQRTLSDRLREQGLPSPAAWIRERRLARAEEMLQAGAYRTVGEVAAAVGMSRAYFTRAFKAQTGHSPGDLLGRMGRGEAP